MFILVFFLVFFLLLALTVCSFIITRFIFLFFTQAVFGKKIKTHKKVFFFRKKKDYVWHILHITRKAVLHYRLFRTLRWWRRSKSRRKRRLRRIKKILLIRHFKKQFKELKKLGRMTTKKCFFSKRFTWDAKASRQRILSHTPVHFHISPAENNFFITFCRRDGTVLRTFSGGSYGFINKKKRSGVTAQILGYRMERWLRSYVSFRKMIFWVILHARVENFRMRAFFTGFSKRFFIRKTYRLTFQPRFCYNGCRSAHFARTGRKVKITC